MGVFIKFTLSAVILIGATVMLATSIETPPPPVMPDETEVLGATTDLLKADVTVNENLYSSLLYKVKNPRDVRIFLNLNDQVSLREFAKSKHCKFIVNGGFYSESFEPIGFLMIDGQVMSKFQENRLFNGILSVNELDTPRITREVPEDPLRIAFQTGPLLYENSTPQIVEPENVKRARRSFAFVTGNNELYFGIVYAKDSSFYGPTLFELPDVLSAVADSHGVTIADAINLDGGTASGLFYDYRGQGQLVTELSTIGSFICVEDEQ